MTVNELIEKLTLIQNAGFGDYDVKIEFSMGNMSGYFKTTTDLIEVDLEAPKVLLMTEMLEVE